MQYDTPIIPAAIEAIQDKKGSGITVIDLQNIAVSSARQFVICEGKSTSQVSAIADNIREEIQRQSGRKPYNYDGYRNSQWIVIDYGDVMVHVFLPEFRELYNLEELWGDGKIENIPDLD
ncbi:MAG: ribosome silencing factor [Muribaculum sp.]|nr:ribosome silencing factor [Muribaculum sp.]